MLDKLPRKVRYIDLKCNPDPYFSKTDAIVGDREM